MSSLLGRQISSQQQICMNAGSGLSQSSDRTQTITHNSSIPVPEATTSSRISFRKVRKPLGQLVSNYKRPLSASPTKPELNQLIPLDNLEKDDDSDDAFFYQMPRFTPYADDEFLSKVMSLYHRLIPADAEILDLCTSWDSHLPNDVQYKFVEGHGMNEGELKANWRLDSSFRQDLNAYPYLPLQDQRFDAVLCCNGFQYLQQPRKVLQEVRRVLKPGGVFIVTFSSHVFPEKALHVWLQRSVIERVSLIVEQLCYTNFENVQSTVEIPQAASNTMTSLDSVTEESFKQSHRSLLTPHPKDPFCAVAGYRPLPSNNGPSIPLKQDVQKLASALIDSESEEDDQQAAPMTDIDAELQRSKYLTAYYNLAKDAQDAGLAGNLIPTLSPNASITTIFKTQQRLMDIVEKYYVDPMYVMQKGFLDRRMKSHAKQDVAKAKQQSSDQVDEQEYMES